MIWFKSGYMTRIWPESDQDTFLYCYVKKVQLFKVMSLVFSLKKNLALLKLKYGCLHRTFVGLGKCQGVRL